MHMKDTMSTQMVQSTHTHFWARLQQVATRRQSVKKLVQATPPAKRKITDTFVFALRLCLLSLSLPLPSPLFVPLPLFVFFVFAFLNSLSSLHVPVFFVDDAGCGGPGPPKMGFTQERRCAAFMLQNAGANPRTPHRDCARLTGN